MRLAKSSTWCSTADISCRSLPGPLVPRRRGCASVVSSRSFIRPSGLTRSSTSTSFSSRSATCRTRARLASAATIQVVVMPLGPEKAQMNPALGRLRLRRAGAADELAQHVGQDAAVAVVVDLDRGVDARLHGNAFLASIGFPDSQLQLLLRPDIVQAADVDGLVAGDAERLR